uniref:RRM domain-containing protein n=1 Tax=Anabas testudineus TaxID=64144 RepID=A0A3Q1JZU2_ANATE
MERTQSKVLHLERTQALETWAQSTKTKLTQVNGQRKYGGPPEVWDGPTPGAHCEVFISQIPRDTYEDQLIPLFSSVGPLWEFRLMMNFSGENRGFAYAKYASPAVAAEAIRLLHGHMLEPGVFLQVSRSTEKRQLRVGHLPASTRQQGLLQVLRGLAQGVERVCVTAGPEEVSAIVAFSSHYAASMAKKMLAEAFKKLFGLTVSVQWQPTVKPDEPVARHNLSFPSPLKPPRLIYYPPQLETQALHPPSRPPGFCRAVGGPTASQHRHLPCSSTAASPLMMLELVHVQLVKVFT